jgi:hypothetical protein
MGIFIFLLLLFALWSCAWGEYQLSEHERAKIIAKYSTTKADSVLVGDRTKLNVSDHDTFNILAQATYGKVLPCLKEAWMMKGKDTSNFKFPDDAEEHFKELKKATQQFRQAPVHEYSGYEGPWIENLWIEKFIDKPLSYFGGMIPLFIQWIDTQILRGQHFNNIDRELVKILRPGVIYLAISQGDVGLGFIGSSHPNILVLAAGGFGHVPLPLVKSEIPHRPHQHHVNYLNITVGDEDDGPKPHKVKAQEYKQDIGFFGTMNQQNSGRQGMLDRIVKAANKLNMTHKYGLTDVHGNWQIEMGASKFNLCPRGYGRSSFRYAESIQIGRIPVFLWDDVPWIPYHGTNLSIEHFGFQRGLHTRKVSTPDGGEKELTLEGVVQEMADMTEHEYKRKLARLHDARWHFTYPGVLHQIEMFIANPFDHHKGGNLRCGHHPRTERCCDE